jgi:hypothetical protein
LRRWAAWPANQKRRFFRAVAQRRLIFAGDFQLWNFAWRGIRRIAGDSPAIPNIDFRKNDQGFLILWPK